nr:MAG TPA_asm: hypothetical protein [Caudoviricetes sp.]
MIIPHFFSCEKGTAILPFPFPFLFMRLLI